MKIFYFNRFEAKHIAFYTQELIKYIAGKTGHEIVKDPKDADFAAVTLAHHLDIKDVKKLRKIVGSKMPIVAGGHASYAPKSIAAFAEFVNLGQGWEFFRDLKDDLNEMKSKPYIYYTGKTGKLRFSQFIDWDQIPLVQTGKNSYSIFWAVGCKMKCNFCATSWINSYQKNPNNIHLQRAREYTKGKQLTVITNDYSESNVRRSVSDATVKEYLKAPHAFDKIALVRVGVESVTERGRYFYGKHIKDKELIEFVRITKERKQEINIFLIAGIDDEDDYIKFGEEILGRDPMAKGPRIFFIVNYFNPNLFTPLEAFDMTKIKVVDFKKILFFWNRINGRTKIYHSNALKPFAKLNQTLKERASHKGELDAIFQLEREKFDHLNGGFDKYLNRAESLGLGDLLRGKFDRLEIDFPYSDKMEKKRAILNAKDLI